MRQLVVAAAGWLTLAACFDPTLPANLACDEGVCPTGLNCNTATMMCEAPGQSPTDGAPPTDANPASDARGAFLLDCPASSELALCVDFEDGLVDRSPGDALFVGFGTFAAGFEGAQALEATGNLIQAMTNPFLEPNYPITVELFLYAYGPAPDQVAIASPGYFAIGLAPTFVAELFTESITGGAEPGPNTWHHVAMVGDVDRYELYIDGQLAGTDLPPLATFPGTTDIRIGARDPDLDPWDGRIDGLRIWKAARSAEQVCEAAGPLCQ